MNFIKENAKYDLIGLGEVMMRLAAPEGELLSESTVFKKFFGGSELNVVSGASMLGGINSAVITKLPENKLGRAVGSKIKAGAVGDELLVYDASPARRLGIYYSEIGAYPRKSSVVYDRAGSSVCSLDISEISESVYADTRLFHISSISLALSATLRNTSIEVIKRMKQAGAAVSFDVNYRAALWSEEEAKSVIEEIFPLVDVLFVSEETSRRMLRRSGTLEEIQKSFADDYGCKIVATTKREAISPKCHNFGSVIYSAGRYYSEEPYKGIDVIDRVGSGDAYVAGVLYGLLTSNDIGRALSLGNALSALKDTVPGDMSIASLSDVEAVIRSHKATGPEDELSR